MSARKSFPIGMIVMFIMAGLAVLGVGYAWWTEQLTVSGSIQTGSIDVKMEKLVVEELDPLNAAACSPKISADGKSITIQITNAYPAYGCSINFDLTNYGTVPARVTNINLPVIESEFGVMPAGALVNKPAMDPEIPVASSLLIRIRPDATPNTSFTFEFSIDITQANAP